MKRVFTRDLILKGQKLISSGLKVKDAATRLGVSPDTLSKEVRKLGTIIPHGLRIGEGNGRKNLPSEAIAAAYIGGKSELALSREYGVNRLAITRRLIELGVKRRNQGEAMPGYGEKEIANALAEKGFPVALQHKFKRYMVDISAGDVAIEIRFCLRGTYGAYSHRFEQIREGYRSVIFIVFDRADWITERLDDIIAPLQRFCRHPAPSGQYGVVRCTVKRNSSDSYSMNVTAEWRSPKSPKTILKS